MHKRSTIFEDLQLGKMSTLAKNNIKACGFYCLVLFCFANIVVSQNISPLFMRITSGDEQAKVEFMKRVKTLPQPLSLLAELDESYVRYEQELFAEDRARQAKIQQLETVLQQNPKAREVLSRLATLYYQEGNEQRSRDYLRRAQAIDPTIQLTH